MSDTKWLDNGIAAAREQLPQISDDVVAKMMDLATGQMSDHSLSRRELENVANTLLELVGGIDPASGDDS